MRLVVEGAGYRCAAQAFVEGNQQAAAAVLRLSAALGGSAGMAGDDASATDFAAAYDDAAESALGVLSGLVGGFASLARLSDASLRNHAAAEAASTLPDWLERVVDPPTVSDRCTVVHVGAPPSSLGGDPSSLPGWANAVLDLLEGVFWPDADTDRLRATAGAWRGAASAVGLLAGPCATALSELAVEVSPEIPLAIATTEDLRARVESLADELVTLAVACEEYADQVDEHRARILDELEQVAVELGIGALVSGVITFFTAGSAAPLAGTAATLRLAAASAKLRAVLESLGALSRGTAATLRPIGAALRDSRVYLARLAAARTERGSASLGSFFSRSPRGLLVRHEGTGRGHTLERHIGRSTSWLHARALRHPTASFASSFTDTAAAERAVFDTLRAHRFEIEAWLERGHRLVLESRLDRVVGVSVSRAGDVVDARAIRVVLVKDPSMAEGFYVKTAYPTP